MKSTTTTTFAPIITLIAAFALGGCSTTAPNTESKIQSPADAHVQAPRVAKRQVAQPEREIEFHFHSTRASSVGRSTGEPSGTRLQPGITAKPKSLFAQ